MLHKSMQALAGDGHIVMTTSEAVHALGSGHAAGAGSTTSRERSPGSSPDLEHRPSLG